MNILKYIFIVFFLTLFGCSSNTQDEIDKIDYSNSKELNIKKNNQTSLINQSEKLKSFEYDFTSEKLSIEKRPRNSNDSFDTYSLLVHIDGIVKSYINSENKPTVTSVEYSPSYILTLISEREEINNIQPKPYGKKDPLKNIETIQLEAGMKLAYIKIYSDPKESRIIKTVPMSNGDIPSNYSFINIFKEKDGTTDFKAIYIVEKLK